MRLLRGYIRTLLEVRDRDDDERSDTFKLIQMFLSEGGSLQAIELAEVLPDADTNIIDMFSIIETRVEEIIEFGRGNFPEEMWKKLPGGGQAVEEIQINEKMDPIWDLLKNLRDVARGEIDGPGHDQEFRKIGGAAVLFLEQVQSALFAVNSVIAGDFSDMEEMIRGGHNDGKHFVELADRFGFRL